MLVRFRAECKLDVERLFDLIPDNFIVGKYIERTSISITHGGADVMVTLAIIGISMKKLRDLMASIPDGHIMHDTLASIEKYTGERFGEKALVPLWEENEEELVSGL